MSSPCREVGVEVVTGVVDEDEVKDKEEKIEDSSSSSENNF
jgi:hypothetical protein